MLPEHEWLDQAKRLPIGMRMRVQHRNESRQNLIIANYSDRWWCYCQRCHEGAVVQKEHVVLGAVAAPDTSIVLPSDVHVLTHEHDAYLPVLRFLASKNMDAMYLPELHYSASRRRLMLNINSCWHGRDLTGKSPSKWINYGESQIEGNAGIVTVLVEDLFSMQKVKWATRHDPWVGVVCILGTQCKNALVHKVMQALPSHVLWFLDADKAGDDGADEGMRRLQALQVSQRRIRPPEGLDPKDMDCDSIRRLITDIRRHYVC